MPYQPTFKFSHQSFIYNLCYNLFIVLFQSTFLSFKDISENITHNWLKACVLYFYQNVFNRKSHNPGIYVSPKLLEQICKLFISSATDNSCIFEDVAYMLGTVPFTVTLKCRRRNNLLVFVNDHFAEADISAVNCIVLYTTESLSSMRQAAPLPKVIVCNEKLFAIASISNSYNNYRHVYSASDIECMNWWQLKHDCLPVKCEIDICEVTCKNWRTVMYLAIENVSFEKLQSLYMSDIGGQNVIKCDAHGINLVREKANSSKKCCYSREIYMSLLSSDLALESYAPCNLKLMYSCPHDVCTAGLCRKHSNVVLTAYSHNFHINVKPRPIVIENVRPRTRPSCSQTPDIVAEEEIVEADMEIEVQGAVQPFENFLTFGGVDGDSEDEEELQPIIFSNAGDVPVFSKTNYIEGHVLLNQNIGLLFRKQQKIHTTVAARRFFENIVSTCSGKSIPLVYPEGMLFTSIFWHMNHDGSVTGAIPKFLYKRTSENSKLGFAGIKEQILSRIANAELLTSTDPRYIQYAFDVVFNLDLSSKPTRIVLTRGFEEVTDNKNQVMVGDQEAILPFEVADSRKCVNELSHLIANESPTYFLTLTCNQSEHPGVKPIFEAVKRWTNDNWEQYVISGISQDEYTKMKVQSAMVEITLAWERASHYLMEFIEKSDEQPLGKIKKLWYRYEFQDSQGNLPHIHALVWCANNDKNSNDVKFKVAGQSACVNNVFHQFHEMGIFPLVGNNDFVSFTSKVSAIQTHSCEKARYRCQKKIRDGKKVCRVPRYYSNDYAFEKFDLQHSDDVWKLLVKCNLAGYFGRYSKFGDVKVLDFDFYEICAELRTGKYTYPASRHEHFCPTNPFLFALTLSSSNLLICSDVNVARYLAKYAAGVEERAKIKFKALTEDEIEAEVDAVKNNKITGVKINDNAVHKGPSGRSLSNCESIWWLFDLPYVVKNTEFIHVSTLPMECRPGVVVLRQKEFSGNAGNVKSEACRVREDVLNLPQNRCFNHNQKLLLSDRDVSNYSRDKITEFGIRPPELTVIGNPKQYFAWFTRTQLKAEKVNNIVISPHEKHLKVDYMQSPWIDGEGGLIKVRESAIQQVDAYLSARISDDADKNQVIDNITLVLDSINDPSVVNRFIDVGKDCAVPVLPRVLPNNPSRFLIHILLSMTEYITEIDLFECGSIIEAFERFGFNDPYELTRKYVLEELKFTPGGSKNFDRLFKNAFELFYSTIVEKQLVFNATPVVLLRNLQEEASEKLNTLLMDRRNTLCEFLLSKNDIFEIPSKVDLLEGNAISWTPCIKRADNQSLESFIEQSEALKEFKNSIDEFLSGVNTFVFGKILCGPPGSGKTHVLKTAVAYAVARGVNAIFTSISGEKSTEFGGAHIHLLFPIPVDERSPNISVQGLAQSTISRLIADPLKLAYVQRLELIAIEEIGLISAELYEIINLVLQHVKCNKSPWGGVLVLASGDHKQLPPVNGSLIWNSPLLLTNFKVFKLLHYVRSALDSNLQKCIEYLRMSHLNNDQVNEICSLISLNCCFVPTWNDLAGSNILRVFGKKSAEKEAVESFHRNIRGTLNENEIFSSKAVDEISRDGGSVWVEPDDNIVPFINRCVLEQQELLIYRGVVMRATYNDQTKHFTQGQLCVVESFNSQECTVTVKFAPPGTRLINNEILANCQEVVIRKITTRSCLIRRQTIARRTQFPLKHYVAATIHKVIGDTIPNIATQFSLLNSKYKLWLKEQLLVVLSRVKFLEGLTFVGSKQDTLLAISTLAAKTSQWDTYTDEVMLKVARPLVLGNEQTVNRVVEQRHHIFNPFHRELPSQPAGYCYLLVSTKNTELKYVGETCNLRRRLNEHNSGHGAEFTRPIHRRPWALYAYITGFSGDYDSRENIEQRRDLEFQWQSVIRERRANIQRSAEIGSILMKDYAGATMVICGELTVPREH